MTDIVERLEEQANTAFTFNITRRDVAEAAAEIKRLREVIDQLQLGQGQDECHWQESKGGRLG